MPVSSPFGILSNILGRISETISTIAMSFSELIFSFVSITIRKCGFAYAVTFIIIIATSFVFLKNTMVLDDGNSAMSILS
jgi:hypothetical protein